MSCALQYEYTQPLAADFSCVAPACPCASFIIKHLGHLGYASPYLSIVCKRDV